MAKVKFKGFRADSTQANWNANRKIYRGNDLSLPMVDQERTCHFHWSTSLDKVTQENIKVDLQFQQKQLWKDYYDGKTIDDANTKYHVIVYGGCHYGRRHFWSLRVVGILTFLLHEMG